MKIDKKIITLGVCVVVCLVVGISAILYADLTKQADKTHEYVTVGYYGIHHLQCPVCDATADLLEIVGHDYIQDNLFDTKETITIIFCHNCSNEFKAK